MATRLKELRAAGQAHTVAFLHGETRGSLRGLVNTFMSAYGSPNVISHAPAERRRARRPCSLTQGINGLPVYDLNNAATCWRSAATCWNPAATSSATWPRWPSCGAADPERGKLVAVQPAPGADRRQGRRVGADPPGTYGALALGMANVIINSELYDQDFVRDFTFGFEDFEDEAGKTHQGFKSLVLEQYTLERVEMITGVPAADIARLAGEFATNRPAVAVLPTEPDGLDGERSLRRAGDPRPQRPGRLHRQRGRGAGAALPRTWPPGPPTPPMRRRAAGLAQPTLAERFLRRSRS